MVLGREHSRALELTKRHEASVNTIFGLQGGRAPCQAAGGPCWHTARADTDMRDVSIGPSLALVPSTRTLEGAVVFQAFGSAFRVL